MKIEIKNIKHAKFASQETDCFEAAVYIDGVKAGTVSNEGHGGPNSYHPFELEKTLDAHAAETLPRLEYEGKDLGPATGDILIGELFNQWLVSKDLQKALVGRVLGLGADGKIYQTKKVPADTLKKWLAEPEKLKKSMKIETVLNLLPFDEALAIYRKGAVR